MKRIHGLVFAFVLLTLVVLPGVTVAAESGDDSVASVMTSEKEIEWLPRVAYDQLVLTVSGTGDAYFSETFPAGTNPVFDLFDNDGVLFPDGSCTYELQVIPKVTSEGIDVSPEERGLSDGVVQEALVQSGYFAISKGYLVVEGVAETDETEAVSEDPPTLTRDICYNDDLIVDGSIGVGFDIACNHSFGFDTIVLKENNLRIFFDDTSNSASFPNNDWRLVANDSSNGGKNKFSIDDVTGGKTPFTIEAGARTNALYVEDDGDIGVGTNVPAVDVHIQTGNTPTLRLHQDGTSGFTPQTWDVAGNEANFFIRDVTNGSTLPFRLRPGAPTDSIEIEADGDVYMKQDLAINTKNPYSDAALQVNTGTDENFAISSHIILLEGVTFQAFNDAVDANVPIEVRAGYTTFTQGNVGVGTGSTPPANLLVVGTGGAYCDGTVWMDGSSREYKENIRSLTVGEALDALEGLNPVKYNYKVDREDEYLGFIAEDVPDLVATKERKGMSPMDVAAVLTKVVQQQQQTIEELQGKIAELEQK